MDGSCTQNTTTLVNSENVKEFEYYVITNKHLVQQYNNINVYLGEEIGEVPATVIEYDDKIDLAVLKFRSRYFFPVCKIGNSKETEKGEFIVSIGNGQGKELFKSYTFGVVSGVQRYVSTDTDGDGVSDWDSEYIQHDAALNECDSGGAIINMKGEIIGINSTKISSSKYNNMSFAIPINLVMEIVSQLEQGIRPKRATLGVSIIDVTAYHQNTQYYQQVYPNMIISKDIKYGFYVTEVDDSGVAYKAGVQPGDIIVMLNNVELKYSYQVRAELGKFIIGSGDIAEMVVIRNNERVTLYIVF
jgi:serine protease Do